MQSWLGPRVRDSCKQNDRSIHLTISLYVPSDAIWTRKKLNKGHEYWARNKHISHYIRSQIRVSYIFWESFESEDSPETTPDEREPLCHRITKESSSCTITGCRNIRTARSIKDTFQLCVWLREYRQRSRVRGIIHVLGRKKANRTALAILTGPVVKDPTNRPPHRIRRWVTAFDLFFFCLYGDWSRYRDCNEVQ